MRLTDNELGQIADCRRCVVTPRYENCKNCFGYKSARYYREQKREKARCGNFLKLKVAGAGGVDTDGSVFRSIRDAGKTKAGSPPSLPPQPTAASNSAGVGGNAEPAPDDLAQSAPQLVAKTLGNRGADESRVAGRAQRNKKEVDR